jgi:heme oxygenase (mycobilin-producing)
MEGVMTVKIFIKRKVEEKNVLELTTLLKRLRSLTLSQPGYISGETLRRLDAPEECMVISTWSSKEEWEAWLANERRKAIQEEIDELLGFTTEYAVYGE